MLTDSLEVAETAEALAQPIEYQSPFTALRQLALTAKLLEEAAIQDSLR
jgi:dGTP triphosphohydrolase